MSTYKTIVVAGLGASFSDALREQCSEEEMVFQAVEVFNNQAADILIFDADHLNVDSALLPKIALTTGHHLSKKADYTFTLPVRIGVLVETLKTLLQTQQSLIVGRLHLNIREQKLMLSGKEMILTDKETDLLQFLMRAYQKGQPLVPREKLLQDVWGYGKNISTHTLATHIYRLRQKIEKDPSNPEILVAEEGGYCLKKP